LKGYISLRIPLIDALTYKASEGNTMVGEKIVAGTSYWAPIDGANVVNETYAIVESTDGIFSLKKNSGYMASFALQQRYNSNVQLDIVTAQDAQSALYLESTVAVTPSSTSVSNNLRHQSYTLQVGSEITALSIKTVTAGPSTLLIALTGYEGNTGVFKMVNGVEEFTRYTTVYEKVSALVLNDGFDLNVVNQKNDAQIPLSARTSMQAAAAEEPTKNRVFDINLLMENLVARFEEFRSSVKNQVYDLLKYKILFYTRYDLADGAWGLINWFNTEERKTMLANLITKDPLLKDELGYDSSTGDMNYFAVAKAALLVFAQWLHKTYIATNAGLNALWNAVMGSQTLADLVAGIFTGVSSALASVKSGLEAAWDGIKSTGEYIIDSVLDAMFSGFTQIGRLFLSTWLYIAAALSQKPVTVDLGSDGVTARFPDGSSTSFLVKYQNRKMLLNGTTLDFMDPLSISESLSVDSGNLSIALFSALLPSIAFFYQTVVLMATMSDVRGIPVTFLTLTLMLAPIFLINLMLRSKTNHETSDLFGEIISNFLFKLSLGALFSWKLDGKVFEASTIAAIGWKTLDNVGKVFTSLFDPLRTTDLNTELMRTIWYAVSDMIALGLTNMLELVIGKGGHGWTLGALTILLLAASFSYTTIFHTFEVMVF